MPITKNMIIEDYKDKFIKTFGEEYCQGDKIKQYEILVLLINSYISKDWVKTRRVDNFYKGKKNYFISLDLYQGGLLNNNIKALGCKNTLREAFVELGIDFEELEEIENNKLLNLRKDEIFNKSYIEPYLNSNHSAYGYGLRVKYKFINKNSSVKHSKNNIWEIVKSNEFEEVKFYGNVESSTKEGRLSFTHSNYESVIAMPYDIPVFDYENNRINTFREWSAETSSELNYSLFNKGDYVNALQNKTSVDEINSILGFDDSSYENRLIRLKQSYFLVCSSLKSILKNYKKNEEVISGFHHKVYINLKNLELGLVIPELIRILIDEEKLSWELAWQITVGSVGFESNNNMKDLEINMVEVLLPRIFMIINEINERYCKELREKNSSNLEEIYENAIIVDGYIKIDNLIKVVLDCKRVV